MKCWPILYSHRYGNDLLVVAARNETSALNKAKKLCDDFDEDREYLEVLEIPNFQIVQTKELNRLQKQNAFNEKYRKHFIKFMGLKGDPHWGDIAVVAGERIKPG